MVETLKASESVSVKREGFTPCVMLSLDKEFSYEERKSIHDLANDLSQELHQVGATVWVDIRSAKKGLSDDEVENSVSYHFTLVDQPVYFFKSHEKSDKYSEGLTVRFTDSDKFQSAIDGKLVTDQEIEGESSLLKNWLKQQEVLRNETAGWLIELSGRFAQRAEKLKEIAELITGS